MTTEGKTLIPHIGLKGAECPLVGPYQWKIDDAFSQGYIRRTVLDDGFSVTHSYLHSSRPLRSSFCEPGRIATFVFMLSGQTSVAYQRSSWKEVMGRGDVYAFVSEDGVLCREVSPRQEMEAAVVMILITPDSVLLP